MFSFSLIQSKTRFKDSIQLLLKQMGRFLLMSLEIGSGPRGRSISQLDGSRAQLREKCSNGRAESMPQSQKMSGIRHVLQTFPALAIIAYTGNSDISNWMTGFSDGCADLLAVIWGFFESLFSHSPTWWSPALNMVHPHLIRHTALQSGFSYYSGYTWKDHPTLDAATQSLPASELELSLEQYN